MEYGRYIEGKDNLLVLLDFLFCIPNHIDFDIYKYIFPFTYLWFSFCHSEIPRTDVMIIQNYQYLISYYS